MIKKKVYNENNKKIIKKRPYQAISSWTGVPIFSTQFLFLDASLLAEWLAYNKQNKQENMDWTDNELINQSIKLLNRV